MLVCAVLLCQVLSTIVPFASEFERISKATTALYDHLSFSSNPLRSTSAYIARLHMLDRIAPIDPSVVMDLCFSS